MSVPGVTYIEAKGDVSPANPNVDLVFAMIGNCASGTDASIAKYGTAKRLYDARGEGPATRIAGHVLRENAGRVECVFYKTPDATPGAFDTIDNSGVTGTAVPAISGTPLNDYDLYIEWVDACTIGTTGGTYKYSINNGLQVSGLTSLGAGSTIVIPQTGGTITLNPPEAGLVTRVAEIREDFLAHIALTSGSVHGAADTGPYTIGSAPTTTAEAITRLGQILTAAKLHVVKTSSSIHGAADTTAQTALNALTAPTTGQEAVAFAIAFSTAFFGASGHAQRTTSSIHGAADTTSVITSTAPTTGTMAAGDIIRVKATGPQFDSDGLTAAFTALSQSSQDFSIVGISGVLDSTLAAVVSAGINQLNARGKHVGVVFSIRNFNSEGDGETEEEWLEATDTEFASYFDDRVSILRGYSRASIDDGNRVRTFDGPFTAPFLARVMGAQKISEAANWVSAGPLNGVSLVDSDGNLIHHDEAELPGSESAHFVTLMRLPDATRRNGAYVTEPWVKKPVDGRIDYLQSRRVANRIARVVKGIAFGELGSSQPYLPGTVPNTGTLYEPAVQVIKRKIAGVLNTPAGVSNDISNPADLNLVEVSPNVTIVGEKVRVAVTVRPVFFKYIGAIDITLDIQL